MKKLVGMQIVVEGLALYSFRDMRNADRGAAAEGPADLRRARRVAPPRLRRAVHRALRAVPRRTPQRTELEDFALEACAHADRQPQPAGASWARSCASGRRSGIDAGELFDVPARRDATSSRAASEKGRRLGPVQGFVIPTLRRCGLLSERVATHYHGFLRANFEPQPRRRGRRGVPALPAGPPRGHGRLGAERAALARVRTRLAAPGRFSYLDGENVCPSPSGPAAPAATRAWCVRRGRRRA